MKIRPYRKYYRSSKSFRTNTKLTHSFVLSGKTVGFSQKTQNQLEKFQTAKDLLKAEKAKIKKEREEKKSLKDALTKKPIGVKLRQDKAGNYYYQARDKKGRILPKVSL